MIWNPFAQLRETNNYPYARLIRSSFKRRIKDAFAVFNGDIVGERMGIFDYIFPFPRLASYIMYKLNSSFPQNMHTTSGSLYSGIALFLLLSIPTVILNIPKLIVTIGLTLLVSPAIVMAHFWFKSINESYIEQIKHLKIRLFNSNVDNNLNILNDQKDLCEEKDLIQVLPFKEFNLLSIRPLCKYPNGSACTYSEYAKEDSVSPRLLLLGLFSIKPRNGEKHHNLLGEPLALIQVTSQNKESINALLNTNMFWTTQHLEAPEALLTLEESMNRMNP